MTGARTATVSAAQERQGRYGLTWPGALFLVASVAAGGFGALTLLHLSGGTTTADFSPWHSAGNFARAVGAAAPSVLEVWAPMTVEGLAQGVVLFLAAFGLTVMIVSASFVNAAQAAIPLIAALVASVVFAALSGFDGIPAIASSVAGIAAAIAVGLVAGLLLRPVLMRKTLAPWQSLLATFGFLVVVQHGALALWGGAKVAFSAPGLSDATVSVGGISLAVTSLAILAFGGLTFFAIRFVFWRSRAGLVFRAGLQDRAMVAALGHRFARVAGTLFVAGSVLAALGGVLYIEEHGAMAPAFGGRFLMLIFATVLVGGPGSITGSFFGALIVGLVARYGETLAPDAILLPVMAVMIVILLWRPRGLFTAAGDVET